MRPLRTNLLFLELCALFCGVADGRESEDTPKCGLGSFGSTL